jgi:integrase
MPRTVRPVTKSEQANPASSADSTPATGLHSIGHVDCPACDSSRRAMLNPEVLADLMFCEAAKVWFEFHVLRVGPGTRRHYTNCIRALTPFFSQLSLREIHVGHLEQYQSLRSSGSGGLRRAGPSLVNHELNTLSQILTRANLWASFVPHYRPLRLPRPKVGCALSSDEEARLFRKAGSNPRWLVAYCCSLVTANTTAGPNEIRNLRMRDVDLDPPAIRITEGVKNEYRRRTIPLNAPAAWALRELVTRARDLGATDPEHYILPHRAANGAKGFDPTRPISSWRGSWEKLRQAAGLPNLRMYDLRHHAITRLLEDEEVSERTVIELAGHVSRAMLERYSHIRMRTKKEAVDALARKGASSSTPPRLVLVKR